VSLRKKKKRSEKIEKRGFFSGERRISPCGRGGVTHQEPNEGHRKKSGKRYLLKEKAAKFSGKKLLAERVGGKGRVWRRGP